jgi:Xaa-Pro dipeptidase
MSSRLERLAAVLEERDIDVFLTTSPFVMGYLKGLHEGGGERLLGLFVHRSGKHRLICPALSENQARRGGVEDVWSWRDGQDAFRLVQETAAEWGVAEGRWAIDDEVRAQHVLALQAALPGHSFVGGGLVVAALTQYKTLEEVSHLNTAGRIADEAFAEMLPQVRAGMTEREVAAILMDGMARRGGKPTFCIIAAGAFGAEPHHETDDTVLKSGDMVVIDWGCTWEGYNADSTRTISIGEPSDPEARRVYGLVYQAQKAARDLIRPGVSFQDIDRAARKVIEDAGFGEFFNHRTGHGLGLRGHEEPNVVEGNAQAVAPGHVFSIEPGIYLPGRFGVRIENIVTVTEEGHHSFNVEPPEELVVV